jgi:hypothetical protein
VVQNHHTVVVVTAPSPPVPVPKSNDPTTSTATKRTDIVATTSQPNAKIHPTSPTVDMVQDGSSSTIPKRRLSPGFLQQEELKNGVTTSKQKVTIDLSNIDNHPVASESTRISSVIGVHDDDNYCGDTTTTTMTTTATTISSDRRTMNMMDSGTESSITCCPHTSTTSTLTDNDTRKLSSGGESDMTTNTTTPTDTISSMITTSSTIKEPPTVISEDFTTTMIRNIAIAIANEKLQLPKLSPSLSTTKESEKSTSSPWSELVELGITTCTKEIVIAAIECLLFKPSHSQEIYHQNLQELSKSSLPNLMPICQHIFENHSYLFTNTATTSLTQEPTSQSKVEMDGKTSRPSTVSATVALSSATTSTVTPETIVNSDGKCSNDDASSSSLIRVITTGSDGEHTIGPTDGMLPTTHTTTVTMNPRNLNDDSTMVTLSTEAPQPQPEMIVSTTRVITRRLSAKGNTGNAKRKNGHEK